MNHFFSVDATVSSFQENSDSSHNHKTIDITGEVCPMTLVKVKLRLEQLPPGCPLHIRLNHGEPLDNLPRSLQDQGYQVSEPTRDGEVYWMTVTRSE